MKTRYIPIYLLIPAALAWGQTGYNARSMGMAGAYQSLARGAEVSNWNPANLGLMDNPHGSLDLLNLGATFGNNSLSLNLYNGYFSQDYFDQHGSWDETAKSEILSHFPSDGFRGFSRVQATPLAVSYKQYAFAVNTFAYSDMRMPKAFFALPLEGLGTDPVSLSDVEGEGVAGTELAFSGGHALELGLPWVKEFSVGATFKYLLGHAYGRVDHAEGYILSNLDSMALDMNYEMTRAGMAADNGSAGSGIGFDLGAAARLSDRLVAGLSLNNLIGGIKFSSVDKEQGSMSLHEAGLSMDEFGNFDEYMDSITVTTDTSYASSETATYHLPRALMLSANYQVLPWLTAEADFQQGLNHTAGNSTRTRLALGTEIRYLSFLPVRLGLAFGGVQGTTLACGLGLDFKIYQLDLAAGNQSGLFNGSKGMSFALSQRIIF
jgi:hypothetical protein